jgi:methyl-accepting chemotaxis protein
MKTHRSIIRLNFYLSLGFGLLMGIIFPVYAGFFVSFNTPLAMLIFIVGCLIAGVMVGLGAYLITKQTILKVIRSVVEEIREISGRGGDLSTEIPIISSDELGELPRQFNQFLGEIRNLIGLTQEKMMSMQGLSAILKENMQNTQKSVEEISKNIHGIKETLSIQLSKVEDNHTAGDQLNQSVLASITHVLELFNQMDNLTNQLMEQSSTIDQILETITSVTNMIGDTKTIQSSGLGGMSKQLMNQMELTLEQNQKSYGKLGAFISNIEDISSRTGTLAINASIEAAHNGKQGEGFKIIANEIRNLASEAENLSSQIGNSLKTSQNETEKSHHNLTQVKDEYTNLFQILEDKLTKLKGETSDIRDANGTIQTNYNYLTELLKSIRGTLNDMNSATDFSKKVMAELESSSEEIQAEIEQIANRSVLISRLTEETGKQVSSIDSSIGQVNYQIMSFNTGDDTK